MSDHPVSQGRLSGQVALITGATGGIGSAVCHAVAQAGGRVVVGYRTKPAAAAALVKDLAGAGHVALACPVDDSAALAAAAAQVSEEVGRLDLLVNNAGMTRFVPHEDLAGLDDDLIDAIFRTNWRGPFACIRAFRDLLAADGGGVVVNVSSIAAVSGMGSNVAYCASKAALNCMTVSLARALAPAIRVLAVSPGLVDTAFIKGLHQTWRDEQAARTPLGRLTDPADVARAVVAAAADLTFSTGCILPVDGGRPLT